MLIISPTYLSEDSSDKELIETPTHITEPQESNSNLDSLIDKGTLRIIFKIKKYYMICI